jgi:hypothetical protein
MVLSCRQVECSFIDLVLMPFSLLFQLNYNASVGSHDLFHSRKLFICEALEFILTTLESSSKRRPLLFGLDHVFSEKVNLFLGDFQLLPVGLLLMLNLE